MVSAQTTYQTTFLFGFERSGTTLLSMMMGAHPLVAVPLTTTGMWYRYGKALADRGASLSGEDIKSLVDQILGEARIGLWDESINRDEVLARINDHSFANIVNAFHQTYADKKRKPYWACLDIATLDHMDMAYHWFPNARFVHIVRDGRDVALSHETMPYGAGNTLDCAQSWDRRLLTNLKMGGMLPQSQYLVIRFEDLVLESETTLENLCRFMGLEYSPQMLAYAEMVDEKIPNDRRWLWPALNQSPQAAKCYGWKTRMSRSKRSVFESEAGSLLHQLGYDVQVESPRSAGGYLYELWCLLGRGGRIRRFGKRFGLHRASKLEREWGKNLG